MKKIRKIVTLIILLLPLIFTYKVSAAEVLNVENIKQVENEYNVEFSVVSNYEVTTTYKNVGDKLEFDIFLKNASSSKNVILSDLTILTENEGVEYSAVIDKQNLELKPNETRTIRITGILTDKAVNSEDIVKLQLHYKTSDAPCPDCDKPIPVIINPTTGDTISIKVLILLASILGLLFIFVLFKMKQKKSKILMMILLLNILLYPYYTANADDTATLEIIINQKIELNKIEDTITFTKKTTPYTGNPIEGDFTSASNTPVTAVYYSDELCQNPIEGKPINNGEYYATASTEGNVYYLPGELGCSDVLEITKAAPSCPTIDDVDVTYDGNAHSLTIGEGLSGGTLNYSLNDGEWTENLPSITDAGTYNIKVMVVGDERHEDTFCKNVELKIRKADDTITMTEVESTYTGNPVTPNFSNISGLEITPTYYSDSSCTEALNGVPINAGEYYATASTEGNNNYKPANLSCTKASTINKAASTCPSIEDVTVFYDGTAHSLIIGEGLSGGVLNYKNNDSSWTDVLPAEVNAGTYTIESKVVGDNNHLDESCGTNTLQINKMDDSITITPVETPYTGTNVEASFSNISGSTITAKYYSDNACTTEISGLPMNVGEYYATATSEGNEAYKPASLSCTKAVTIGKLTDTITLTEIEQSYTGDAVEANLSNLSHTEITTVYYSDSACSIVMDSAPTNAGEYYVTASSEGDDVYTSASLACSKAITINVVEPTCPVINNVNTTYNGESHSLDVGSGLIGGTMAYSIDGGEWSDTIPSAINAGTYTINSKVVGDNNHSDKSCGTNTITIDQLGVMVMTSNQTKEYDGTPLVATSDCSFVGTYDGYSVACTNSGSITDVGETPKTIETVTITKDNVDVTNNFLVAKTNGTLSITKAAAVCPTIQNVEVTYDGEPHSLTIGSDIVGGTMSYSLDGETWTITNPSETNVGTYTINSKVVGDSNHNDTNCGSNTIKINKITDTITSTPVESTYTGSPVAGNFSNISQTEISATYYSDSSCSHAMNGLPTNVGEYYATATSEGNNIYTSASLECSKSVTITKAESVCPALGDFSITYDGEAHSITVGSGLEGGTLSYKLDDGEWTDTLPTVVNVGVYTVKTKVVGDDNHNNKSCGTNTITISEIPKLDDVITIEEVSSEYTGNAIGAIFSNLSQTEIIPTYYSDNACSNEIDGSPIDVGTYYATAVSEGNDDYKSAELACSKAVTITKAAAVCPTITNVEVTYDGSSHPLNVGSDLVGGTMSYSVDGGNWSGTLPSKTDVGTYNIESKVVADSNHNDTNCGSNTIIINKINDVITANVVEETYTGNQIAGSFTNLSNTEITPTYYYDNSCSNPVGGLPTESGEYYATATSSGNENYTAASLACTKSVVINKAPATCPTITDVDETYDGNYHELIVGDDYSGGTLLFNIDDSGWIDYTPSATTAGYHEVETMISGDDNHSDTDCGTNSITIYKKSVTIVTSDQSKEYDGSELTADDDCEIDGGISGDFTTSCYNSGSITDAGTEPKVIEEVYIYDPNGDYASDNFNITKVNGTLTVTPSPTAYIGECIDPSYDESIYDGEEKTIISNGYYVEYSQDTAVNAGDHEITVTTDPNYSFDDGTTVKTITCSIRKRDITIYPKEQDIKYGEEISKTVEDVTYENDDYHEGLASSDSFHSITLTQTRTEPYSINDEDVDTCDKGGSGDVGGDELSSYTDATEYGDGAPEHCLGITPSNVVIYNYNNEDVTDNYNITYKDGALLIHYELTLNTGDHCAGYNDGGSGDYPTSIKVDWYYKEFSLYNNNFERSMIIYIEPDDGYSDSGLKQGNQIVQKCNVFKSDDGRCDYFDPEAYNPTNIILDGNNTYTSMCADELPPTDIQLEYGSYYDGFVTDHDFKVRVSAYDIGTGVSKVELYYRKCGDSNYTKVEQTFEPSRNFSEVIEVNSCLSYGDYYGYVVVTDAEGNSDRSSDFEIRLEAPTADKVTIDKDSIGTSCKTLDCAINELFKYYSGNYGGE